MPFLSDCSQKSSYYLQVTLSANTPPIRFRLQPQSQNQAFPCTFPVLSNPHYLRQQSQLNWRSLLQQPQKVRENKRAESTLSGRTARSRAMDQENPHNKFPVANNPIAIISTTCRPKTSLNQPMLNLDAHICNRKRRPYPRHLRQSIEIPVPQAVLPLKHSPCPK